MAIIDTAGTPRIARHVELPFVEEYPGGRSQIRWMGVTDSTVALLLGRGAIHRFKRGSLTA